MSDWRAQKRAYCSPHCCGPVNWKGKKRNSVSFCP